MRFSFICIISALFLISCGNKDASAKRINSIPDLPFHKAKDAKEYADLILKCVITNREKPLASQFTDLSAIDLRELEKFVSMYSTGIGGRSDWEKFDIYALSDTKNLSKGFDYAWLEPKGRLGIQIYILPKLDKSGRFSLHEIEFRSRIDVMQSMGFPHGPINDYKKLNFNW